MFGFPMRITLDDGRMILMRPIVEDEMPAVAEQISRYEICRHISLRGSQSPEQELAWLKSTQERDDAFNWGIALPESKDDTHGRLIGNSGVFDISCNRGESGVVLWDSSVWGTGIASAIHRARCHYAVNVHHLVAIDSGADQDNHGSRMALERVGYTKVGVSYNRGYVDGEICHLDKLLWVNPTSHVWNYFWGGEPAPKKFQSARKRAIAALDWAAERIEYL